MSALLMVGVKIDTLLGQTGGFDSDPAAAIPSMVIALITRPRLISKIIMRLNKFKIENNNN